MCVHGSLGFVATLQPREESSGACLKGNPNKGLGAFDEFGESNPSCFPTQPMSALKERLEHHLLTIEHHHSRGQGSPISAYRHLQVQFGSSFSKFQSFLRDIYEACVSRKASKKMETTTGSLLFVQFIGVFRFI